MKFLPFPSVAVPGEGLSFCNRHLSTSFSNSEIAASIAASLSGVSGNRSHRVRVGSEIPSSAATRQSGTLAVRAAFRTVSFAFSAHLPLFVKFLLDSVPTIR